MYTVRIQGLVKAYENTKLYPIQIADLDIDPTIMAPIKRKLRGCVSKKRRGKGYKKDLDYQGQQRCGNCKMRAALGEKNHNRLTCKQPPTHMWEYSKTPI